MKSVIRANKDMKPQIRQSNIELLRIFAMILIVAHHYAYHGGAYSSDITGFNQWIAIFLVAGGKLGVDLFVMITGYFMVESSFKIMRLIRLEAAVLFYSIVFYFIACLGLKIEQISFLTLRNAFLPTLTNLGNGYWFIPCYFGILIISPFINRIIATLSKKQYQQLLFGLLLLISVIPTILQSTPWFDGTMGIFILLYLLGGYIRRENISLPGTKKRVNLGISICLYGCIVAMTMLVKTYVDFFGKFGISAEPIWSLNSFFVVMLAVVIFMFFIQVEIKPNEFINHVSKTTIGIYLIHDNLYVRQYMWLDILHTDRYYTSKWLPLHAVCCVLVIFVVSAVVEQVRSVVMAPIMKKIGRSKFIESL